ncbi:MAG: DNA mismatch repair endonuclease MutL [Chlorobi bacterium]|nr:DNA mismatch repair endonuclease MutL [Chlorobiota bacterium]
MSDIIQLLPDSVANQIAAGEVIQRPASVVKELIENALDADADKITVNIKDAGKTLIQIIDNGKGMSETDARMAFERHATSKIRMAEDLFTIQTMGFRGEALASIAAVADVELKTRPYESELGTYIHIKGSSVTEQETVSTDSGSNFSVKNLFFNIPARRKFLKKDSTEFNHIVTEFKKVALAHPEIIMNLYHNENVIYKLPSATLIQRIINIFGKSYKKNLVAVNSETSILNINGYIGTPGTAKKRNEEQYFFVNKRFMRHPYFYKAIQSAYEQIIRPNLHPSFFLYFDIAPEHIDINIHPAKIQINFDDTQGIFQLLRASVRQALGRSNIVPSIDFDTDGSIKMPYIGKNTHRYSEPDIKTKKNYNPFDDEDSKASSFILRKNTNKQIPDNWDVLYKDFESKINFDDENTSPDDRVPPHYTYVFQFKKKYVITSISSGIIVINITRAQERIIFEQFITAAQTGKIHSQQLVYPLEIQMNSTDINYLKSAETILEDIGFTIKFDAFDKLIIEGIPGFLILSNPKELIETILIQIKDDPELITENANEKIAELLAKKNSISFAKVLAEEELQHLVNSLLTCRNPNYTNDGRKIIHKINTSEVDKFFA